jgi:peptidoglycan/LPS O-acetylase OafA/YrhL
MAQMDNRTKPPTKQSFLNRFLSRFRRVTSSGNFIGEIDGLRFIAIGFVVLFHLVVGLGIKAPLSYTKPQSFNWLSLIALQGFHGVELFFIISGFILAYPFASHFLKDKPKVNLKQYFLRRLTRLEPPYMLCMLIIFMSFVFFKDKNFATLLPHLTASLLYLHNFIFGTESTINNVAWSLEIEIQFYLLVPILSSVFAVRNKLYRRAIMISLCMVSMVVGLLFITPNGRLYLSIVRFLHFFLLGFLLADVYLIDWKETPDKKWFWDIISLIGWMVLIVIWNLSTLWPKEISTSLELGITQFLFPSCAFFLYCAVFRGPLTNKIITNPWITTLGGMCYTIYLLHNHIIGIILNYTEGFAPSSFYAVNVILQFFIVVPLMLVPAGVYFLAIEKPCMRKDWPRRLWEKTRSIVHREM